MIVSGPAAAQSGGDEAWLAGEEQEQPAGEEEPAEGETAGEQDAAVEGEPAPPEGEDTAWLAGKEVKEVEAPEEDTTYQLKEQPDKWYYGIGARFRYIPIPAGEQKWFGVKEAETVHGWGTGIEAIFRHKGLSIIPAVWFAQLARDDVVYRGKDDEWEDTEVWDIDLKMLMVSIEFLASYTIKDWLYLTYGGGFGGIFRLSKGTDKDLIRNEGYHEDGKWHTCDGPDPLAGGNADFCEENGHYDQNWSGWAADPFYPYVDIVVGLRFKPVPNFYVALDTGIVLPLLPLLGVRAGAMF
jgi:hypothetical protein